jgi:hypothetical protein
MSKNASKSSLWIYEDDPQITLYGRCLFLEYQHYLKLLRGVGLSELSEEEFHAFRGTDAVSKMIMYDVYNPANLPLVEKFILSQITTSS